TTGEPSESESEGSPMPGESKRPAFSPAATGEVPPHALQYDVAQQAHTSAAQSAPRESAFVPQSMSEPTGHTARPGIKFGLLTWGLLLIIAGIAIWMLPWMEHIDWSLAAVIVFGLLGVILLIVAALASFSNHRRKNRG
ncbi:MAG: hypothetical protein Q4P05_09115, partial [Actinomycetaceae bacterium]|nr:hypothetical protein [Actinomycetaceae bacterium]